MFLNEQSSFVAAMLFSVHPIHTEAVSLMERWSSDYEAVCEVNNH